MSSPLAYLSWMSRGARRSVSVLVLVSFTLALLLGLSAAAGTSDDLATENCPVPPQINDGKLCYVARPLDPPLADGDVVLRDYPKGISNAFLDEWSGWLAQHPGGNTSDGFVQFMQFVQLRLGDLHYGSGVGIPPECLNNGLFDSTCPLDSLVSTVTWSCDNGATIVLTTRSLPTPTPPPPTATPRHCRVDDDCGDEPTPSPRATPPPSGTCPLPGSCGAIAQRPEPYTRIRPDHTRFQITGVQTDISSVAVNDTHYGVEPRHSPNSGITVTKRYHDDGLADWNFGDGVGSLAQSAFSVTYDFPRTSKGQPLATVAGQQLPAYRVTAALHWTMTVQLDYTYHVYVPCPPIIDPITGKVIGGGGDCGYDVHETVGPVGIGPGDLARYGFDVDRGMIRTILEKNTVVVQTAVIDATTHP